MDIIVRFAKEYDWEDMAEIHALSKKKAYSEIIHTDILDCAVNDKEYRDKHMKIRMQKRISLVADSDESDELLGFAQFVFGNESSNPSYANAELCSLYVHPNFQSVGVGTALLNRVKQLCRAGENYNLALFCLKENDSAIQFYKKNGGTIIKEQMLEFGDKEYPAVIFLFDLREHDGN